MEQGRDLCFSVGFQLSAGWSDMTSQEIAEMIHTVLAEHLDWFVLGGYKNIRVASMDETK